jgi:hypothetical protein
MHSSIAVMKPFGVEECQFKFTLKRKIFTSTVPSTKNPVFSCTIVSHGPPLSHAITGRPNFRASNGVIPKCSFTGVYNNAVHRSSKKFFMLSLTEGKNRISLSTPKLFASLRVWSDENDKFYKDLLPS